MREGSSIVERLGYRSVTGYDLRLHFHRHSATTNFLFLNTTRDTGCCRSYIGSRSLHSRDDTLFMKGLLHGGLNGGVSVLNCWELNEEIEYRRPCIFLGRLISESQSWSTYQRCKMGFPEFICRCPVIKNALILPGPHMCFCCLRTGTGTTGG